MNINIEKIAENDNILLKLGGIILLVIFIVAPGSVLIFLETPSEFLSLDIYKTLLLGIIFSVPLNFLGFIAYLHPYKTMMEFVKYSNSKREIFWNVSLGAGLWGVLSAIILYFFVHTSEPVLSKYFEENVILKYIAVYAGLVLVFSVLFSINAKRFLRDISVLINKNEEH